MDGGAEGAGSLLTNNGFLWKPTPKRVIEPQWIFAKVETPASVSRRTDDCKMSASK
jgi:hypothetical protein